MNFNSSDYFSYKRSKIQMGIEKPKKKISKFNFLFQLFIATFIIMFIIIVVTIMKYSSKVDIEYAKGDFSLNNPNSVSNISEYTNTTEDEQRKIDKRLILIQQEDNAPSEAKIITNGKQKEDVIDPVHFEDNKKLEKKEKFEKAKEIEVQETKPRIAEVLNEIKNTKKQEEPTVQEKNVTILSKVLVGRYSTFEEAQKAQSEIKEKLPSSTPFVRKTGDVFCVQMGSYQDFSVAKNQAQTLKSKGFDVWIYQQ